MMIDSLNCLNLQTPYREKLLLWKGLELCTKQQEWKDSLEEQKMNEFRRSLPSYKEKKNAFLRAISQNQVLVVSGENGCGKTTQLPQYILESEIKAGRGASCRIMCTQPWRISAMSLSERVAAECGEKIGQPVGYKVRVEGKKGSETHLLFCTTGILLRRLLVDRNLKGVTWSTRTLEALSCWNPDSIGFNLIQSLLCHVVQKERPGAVLVFMTDWDDINSLKDQLQAHPLLGDPRKFLLLACHGSMASSEQRLLFDKPEEGTRKIVLATHMAETSITINKVVFVVDCGKPKETSYDALNNTPCLLPTWISKAAATNFPGDLGDLEKVVLRIFESLEFTRIMPTLYEALLHGLGLKADPYEKGWGMFSSLPEMRARGLLRQSVT